MLSYDKTQFADLPRAQFLKALRARAFPAPAVTRRSTRSRSSSRPSIRAPTAPSIRIASSPSGLSTTTARSMTSSAKKPFGLRKPCCSGRAKTWIRSPEGSVRFNGKPGYWRRTELDVPANMPTWASNVLSAIARLFRRVTTTLNFLNWQRPGKSDCGVPTVTFHGRRVPVTKGSLPLVSRELYNNKPVRVINAPASFRSVRYPALTASVPVHGTEDAGTGRLFQCGSWHLHRTYCSKFYPQVEYNYKPGVHISSFHSSESPIYQG
jgi:hypothetical protein